MDFRGFDTLGEICVLLVAGLAVQALLKEHAPGGAAGGAQRAAVVEPEPPVAAGHPGPADVLPLTMLVAVFVLLRGHSLPGGGFIAALITAVVLLLQYVASGVLWTEARIALDYRALAGSGILVAGLTGLGSWAFGFPFLTTAFGHFHLPVLGEIELATAVAVPTSAFISRWWARPC
ncbi:hydrogen gas-evolving membrane-bound hydrogenase subunit E [Cupriavidus basilensis]